MGIFLQDVRYGLRNLMRNPRLRARRDADAGAGHWRQHHHLQRDQQHAIEAAAVPRARTAWCWCGRPSAKVPTIGTSSPRPTSGISSGRATPSRPWPSSIPPAEATTSLQRATAQEAEQVSGLRVSRGLLFRAGRQASSRPHVPSRGRDSGQGSRSRAQLRTVEDALRRRSVAGRQDHPRRWRGLHGDRRDAARIRSGNSGAGRASSGCPSAIPKPTSAAATTASSPSLA